MTPIPSEYRDRIGRAVTDFRVVNEKVVTAHTREIVSGVAFLALAAFYLWILSAGGGANAHVGSLVIAGGCGWAWSHFRQQRFQGENEISRIQDDMGEIGIELQVDQTGHRVTLHGQYGDGIDPFDTGSYT